MKHVATAALLLPLCILLFTAGCQSVKSPDRARGNQTVPEAHAFPVAGVDKTPIKSVSAENTERAHNERFDGRLSRALEPEDIQSSRTKQNQQQQQQQQQQFVIKQGDDD